MSSFSQSIKHNFGITEKSYCQLMEGIKQFSEIEKVIIFGSRAMGNAKTGSDIDLAIFATEVAFDTVSRLKDKLNEQMLIPYFVDVVHFEALTSEELKQHIIEEGKIVYQKDLIK
jgi:predicted nucleotidyltransferase